MQNSRNILVLVCCLGALWGCGRQLETEGSADLTEEVAELLPDQPTDPAIVAAAPTMARTVFANEWVAVARVTLPPGELIPPHDAGVRYALPLSESTLSVIDSGKEEIVHILPGEIATWPEGRLSFANVNDSEGDFLIIERSAVSTSPDLETLAIPDVAVEMQRHGTVLLDNENVLVVDTRLDQLEGNPLPPNLPLLVVASSDCDLEFQGAAVTNVEEVMMAGEAIWLPAGYDVVSNVGNAEAHAFVFGFRR
ncbi:MAG: hypothetical protein OQK55_06690 [Thermoanaerobaculales bacterium]|nr:hypothetical protein [Thermoanaerobaculales bacterium]